MVEKFLSLRQSILVFPRSKCYSSKCHTSLKKSAWKLHDTQKTRINTYTAYSYQLWPVMNLRNPSKSRSGNGWGFHRVRGLLASMEQSSITREYCSLDLSLWPVVDNMVSQQKSQSFPNYKYGSNQSYLYLWFRERGLIQSNLATSRQKHMRHSRLSVRKQKAPLMSIRQIELLSK